MKKLVSFLGSLLICASVAYPSTQELKDEQDQNSDEIGRSDIVVAMINGDAISELDIDVFVYLTEGRLADNFQDKTYLREVLLSLGESEAIGREARSRGLDQSLDYQLQMKAIANNLLEYILFQEMIANNEFDEAGLRSAYELMKQDEAAPFVDLSEEERMRLAYSLFEAEKLEVRGKLRVELFGE